MPVKQNSPAALPSCGENKQAETDAQQPKLKRSPDAPIVESELADLCRLRAIGMEIAEQVGRRAAGELSGHQEKALGRTADATLSFARIARAVRQIVVLEQEIMGLRAPASAKGRNVDPSYDQRRLRDFRTWVPEADSESDPYAPSDLYDDSDDYDRYDDDDDYLKGSFEQIVARVRSALGISKDGVPASNDAALPAVVNDEAVKPAAKSGAVRTRAPPYA